MRRGSTPTQSFRFPYEAKDLANIRVTYAQDNKQVLQKGLESCTIEDGYLYVSLEQEDTLKFKAGVPCEAQIHALFRSGARIPSNIVTFRVERSLDNEVMK